MKIRLNHKCLYCKKAIYLGEHPILSTKGAFHFKCAVMKFMEEIEKPLVNLTKQVKKKEYYKFIWKKKEEVFGDFK